MGSDRQLTRARIGTVLWEKFNSIAGSNSDPILRCGSAESNDSSVGEVVLPRQRSGRGARILGILQVGTMDHGVLI